MKRTIPSLLTLFFLLANSWASAQDKYPSRPVTLIVPEAAGGANDAIARVIAQKLGEQTGQTFVVDNRTGAGGNTESDSSQSQNCQRFASQLRALK